MRLLGRSEQANGGDASSSDCAKPRCWALPSVIPAANVVPARFSRLESQCYPLTNHRCYKSVTDERIRGEDKRGSAP